MMEQLYNMLSICKYMHMDTNIRLSSAEVAKMVGIHKDTLLRWLRSGLVPEPMRNRHGWRAFTLEEANAVVAVAQQTTTATEVLVPSKVAEDVTPYFAKLQRIDWDFVNAKTSYLTHGIHPYPAKFIPQIPNALIQELSSVGDTIGDIFSGSGTTLVEALTLKRHAVGIDANPLACLITKAKTAIITEDDAAELMELSSRAKEINDFLSVSREGELFPTEPFISKEWRPNGDTLNFWFEAFIVEELAECLSWCRRLNSEAARTLALAAFSSIVVAVSRQDSDTRYVRRNKPLIPGEAFRRFAKALEQATRASAEFSELVESRFTCQVIEADLLTSPTTGPIDLVVCSPPYPNAYSYHLYHMTRMLWMCMDQPRFKREEIGSHRKYSSNSKNGATAETFRLEFGNIMKWLSGVLRKDGYACFVVGDSTLKGARINNADIISEAGLSNGFAEIIRIDRTMQATKKAFNPVIGKIKSEKILIMQNRWSGT